MVSRIRNFFRSMERVVTFKTVVDQDGLDSKSVFLKIDDALVSFSGSSLNPASETINQNSIRVFIHSKPAVKIGDLLAISDTNNSKDFNYVIVSIDDTATGYNAKKYKCRIEATRRS